MGSQLLIIIFFPGMTIGLYLTGRGPKKTKKSQPHSLFHALGSWGRMASERDTKLQINTF